MSLDASYGSVRLLLMPLQREQDVVLCRNRARIIAAALGFDRQQQVRIATAVSEIARNAFRYASRATAEFMVIRNQTLKGMKQRFVTVVHDRGPGIPDLPPILAGTHQGVTGLGRGILSAKRLMDNVDIKTGASGTTVRLEQELPRFVDLAAQDLQRITAEVSRSSQVKPLDELAEQSQELIATFDRLNAQHIELEKINEEMSETNRGVVALYDELDTVQRVSRVVASKLDLSALLQAIIDATVEVSNAECGGFFRKELQSENFTCQTVGGPLGVALQKCSLVNVDELIGAETEQRIIRNDDLSLCTRPFPLSPQLSIRSFLALSVHNSKGGIAGALAFGHRAPAIFTERTERILTVVAVQLSVGLENARLYQSAQAATAARDQFLAILSHELRTPLTPVFTILDDFEKSPDLPEIVRSDLLVIRRNLQLESRLIDDLLDLARIRETKLSLNREITDVHALIESVYGLCKAAIDQRQVQFQIKLQAGRYLVLGDPGRLQQVFWNLFNNAVKFTPDGGSIEVETSVVAGTEFRVRITDSGPGIGSDSLVKIFEPFEQADLSVSRQFGGLGLGLAISKGIVDAHEGQILAESPGRGRGSTFTVSLPLAEAQQIPNAPLQIEQSQTASKAARILLVDDHEDTLEFMSRLLRRYGHQVATASTHRKALSLGQQEQFDLLIADIGLPDGSGYGLLATLQAVSPIKGIILSGYTTQADVDRSIAAGFSAHLKKPCDISVLDATIGKVLS
jgi:signal transduction histidine kinase/CheY-like chemotaxis protein